jgi:hypothetical protein
MHMMGKSLLFVAVLALAAAAKSDIVVTRQDLLSGLTLGAGGTFRVPRLAEYERWAVTYPRAIVRALNTDALLERPAPEGWRFKAIGNGSGELTFTAFVPPNRGGNQPNPPRFVLQVTVR